MDVSSYPQFVAGLFKDKGEKELNLVHAAMGIGGESGELVDIIKKHWAYGKPLDIEHVQEEIGDIFFYIQALCNVLELDPTKIVESNMKKLVARYPEGKFSLEAALARADKVNE